MKHKHLVLSYWFDAVCAFDGLQYKILAAIDCPHCLGYGQSKFEAWKMASSKLNYGK